LDTGVELDTREWVGYWSRVGYWSMGWILEYGLDTGVELDTGVWLGYWSRVGY